MFEGMKFNEWFGVFAALVGSLVVPFTLLGIWRNRVMSQEADNWRARQEEIGTYNDVNNRYADFLKTLLANPDIDIGEFGEPGEITSGVDKYKRDILYAMLVTRNYPGQTNSGAGYRCLRGVSGLS